MPLSTIGTQIDRHLDEAGVAPAPGNTGCRPTPPAVDTVDGSGAAHDDVGSDGQCPVPDVAGAALVRPGSIGALADLGATAVHTAFADTVPSTLLSFDAVIRPDVMAGQKTSGPGWNSRLGRPTS